MISWGLRVWRRLRLVELLIFGLNLFDPLRLVIFSLPNVRFGLLRRLIILILNFLKNRTCQVTLHSPPMKVTSWMGEEMNSECFFTVPFISFSSRYSS